MTHSPSPLPETAQIGRTALTVSDLDLVTEFYRDVLGLDVIDHDGRDDHGGWDNHDKWDDRDERDGGGPTATLGADGVPLLVLMEDEDAPARQPAEAGLFHNAFRVPSRAALGDALGRIRDRWQLDGASDHGVSEALYLSDPEGNGIEVYRDRPAAEWPMAADGSVQMDTLPLDLDDVAADASGEPNAPSGTTVGHVHLEVSSLNRAREFYVETLGLNVRMAFRQSALFLAAGTYHHHLGVNTWQGRSQPKTGRGLAWFEFVVPDEPVLGDLRERLEAAGVLVSDGGGDWDEGIENQSGVIECADPDGIVIRIRTS